MKTAMLEQNIDDLWQAYGASRSIELRNRIVEHYLPLLNLLSHRLYGRLPRGAVDWQDLIQDGAQGLMQAVEKYAPQRGVKFTSFATRRIHGAMVDGLRERDWVPRLVRQRGEAAIGMGSLFDTVYDNGVGKRITHADQAVCPRSLAALQSVDDQDALRRILLRMHWRTREMLQLYFAGYTMREIGRHFGVSESRVSQKFSQVDAYLRGLSEHGGSSRPVLNRRICNAPKRKRKARATPAAA